MATRIKKAQPRVILRHGTSGKWLYFTSLYRTLTTRRTDELLPLLHQLDEAVRQDGSYAAGFISYEAAPGFDSSLPAKDDGAFPLLWFGLFRKVKETENLPKSRRTDITNLSWQPSLTKNQYYRCFNSIREYLLNGDTYQVNFTYRLKTKTDADPWEFFLQIMSNDAPPYAAFIDTGEWVVCSASPELFFRLDGNQIESRPMKGTAKRGLWSDDDCRRARELRSSDKERAENIMIVDMMRNDLGRIALNGSINVPFIFSVEKYPTVWQMTSTVRAITPAPLEEIFAAMFPPSSVTGAPKGRTMEIVAELETSPRRIYTGAIGFVAPKRQAQFNVAIRTVLMHKSSGQWEYGVGGGIVWDSEPVKELDECSVKAKVLKPRRETFELLETMLWSPSKGYVLLDYHLKRLAQSADYFGFHIDLYKIRKYLENTAAELPLTPHRLRLVLTRNGIFHGEVKPLGPASTRFENIPLAGSPVDSNDVFLYHKTTRRFVYEDAVRKCPGSEDVLLFNEAEQITESTVANVAVEIDGALCTPPLSCGLLPGTYRAWLLEQRRVQEKVISIEEALRSPNVYLMNSVRGMQKIRIVKRDRVIFYPAQMK